MYSILGHLVIILTLIVLFMPLYLEEHEAYKDWQWVVWNLLILCFGIYLI